MEEAAGGGSRGRSRPKLDAADRQDPHPVPRGINTHRVTGLQLERTSSLPTRRGLLQLCQLPSVLVCSLPEHVEVTDDRFGVKTPQD